RLISWQCNKQIIVATSTTKAEYVAAANCYGQMLNLRRGNCWKHGCSLSVGFYHHTTNGHQFTMSNRHQELASPEQTASALAIPGQTTTGKESSNPLMADSLPKTIQSNDPPLSRGYTLGSGEDSLKLMELMAYSGYQQKDRKPSQNDKTEHGMEKIVQNQGQSPKMPKSESILKNQQSNRSRN
ncbi:hypothetical protein Tco_1390985, partial [Tanacetum coccineum]